MLAIGGLPSRSFGPFSRGLVVGRLRMIRPSLCSGPRPAWLAHRSMPYADAESP